MKRFVRIPVIRMQGVIRSGSRRSLSVENIDPLLNRAFEMSGVGAVAILVNSPGGSAGQSELLYRRLREYRQAYKIPLYAFVEDAAVSGGYMIACAADEIYVLETSMVGSIGVISAGFGFVDLIRKIGVERRVYSQGSNKGMLDPFLNTDPNHVGILAEAQKDVHETFIQIVRGSRGLRLKETPGIFTGEFWTGKRAVEMGLADGFGTVLSVMKQKMKDCNPRFVPVARRGLSEILPSIFSSETSTLSRISDEISDMSVWSRIGMQ